MYDRIYNFSAGPATMPVEVLEEIRDELLNYRGSGMSVMEMSHRPRYSRRSTTRRRPTCASSWPFPTITKSCSFKAVRPCNFPCCP